MYALLCLPRNPIRISPWQRSTAVYGPMQSQKKHCTSVSQAILAAIRVGVGRKAGTKVQNPSFFLGFDRALLGPNLDPWTKCGRKPDLDFESAPTRVCKRVGPQEVRTRINFRVKCARWPSPVVCARTSSDQRSVSEMLHFLLENCGRFWNRQVIFHSQ